MELYVGRKAQRHMVSGVYILDISIALAGFAKLAQLHVKLRKVNPMLHVVRLTVYQFFHEFYGFSRTTRHLQIGNFQIKNLWLALINIWQHVEPFVQNVYNSMLQIIRNYAAKQIYPRALLL